MRHLTPHPNNVTSGFRLAVKVAVAHIANRGSNEGRDNTYLRYCKINVIVLLMPALLVTTSVIG